MPGMMPTQMTGMMLRISSFSTTDGMWETIIPVNDVEVIKAIKPGGIFDPRTGLELIDDNTLPEWLLSKCKKTGAILRDPDGKPYLSIKMMISLLMGAIRQLDAAIRQLEADIQKRQL